jgi:hypothetical protein
MEEVYDEHSLYGSNFDTRRLEEFERRQIGADEKRREEKRKEEIRKEKK